MQNFLYICRNVDNIDVCRVMCHSDIIGAEQQTLSYRVLFLKHSFQLKMGMCMYLQLLPQGLRRRKQLAACAEIPGPL